MNRHRSGVPNTNAAVTSLPGQIRAVIESLSPAEAEALRFNWNWWARRSQRAPESAWANWLILAGRGFGKTRIGAEMVRLWVQDFPLVNLIGATAADARGLLT